MQCLKTELYTSLKRWKGTEIYKEITGGFEDKDNLFLKLGSEFLKLYPYVTCTFAYMI